MGFFSHWLKTNVFFSHSVTNPLHKTLWNMLQKPNPNCMLLGKNRKPVRQITRLKENNPYWGDLGPYWWSIQVIQTKHILHWHEMYKLAVYLILNSKYNCTMLCFPVPKILFLSHRLIFKKLFLNIYYIEFDNDNVHFKKFSIT